MTSVPETGDAVAVSEVTMRFGDVTALRAVSLTVSRGEMFGVIGPDGAGKTTLLRAMCGLLSPEDGTVRVFGHDPVQAHHAVARVIGYVSQRFSLYGDLSIDENIEFFARLHHVRDFDARRTRLLRLTGLEPFRRRLADRLSGGMKQKLALACTLVHEPPLLVLDEPTTGVDPVSRREFWKLLAEFLLQGLTIVLATPYLDEAERCGRVVLLNAGTVLALDEPRRIQASLTGTIFEVVTAEPRVALDLLRKGMGEEHVQLFGDRLHVRVTRPDEREGIVRLMAQAGLAATSVREIGASLEDVFIERLGALGPRTNQPQPDQVGGA